MDHARLPVDVEYTGRYNRDVDSHSALLRTALHLFASRGFENVGVQEIASATGLTKPTLYHFFGSKQGLLEALFSTYADELDMAIMEAAVYQGDLPQTLDRIAAAYVGFATRKPESYSLELALYFAPRQSAARMVAAQYYRRRHAALERVFAAAAKDHGNLRNRQQRYAISFVGVLNSYIALQLDGEITITNRMQNDIVRQFSHGIYS